MADDSERLKWLALAVLWREVDRAGNDPCVLGVDIRLAMAVLARMGADDDQLRDLWRHLRDPLDFCHSEAIRAYQRRTWGHSKMRGIARSVGIELMGAGIEGRLHAMAGRQNSGNGGAPAGGIVRGQDSQPVD